MTEKSNIDYKLRVPGEGNDGLGSLEEDEVAVGTVQCDSWRTYTIGYQLDFLLTNRQIYREAWHIFQLENNWTIIRVNKAGFGEQLRAHGFPVASADSLWCHIKFAVMDVTVIFPSLEDRKEKDTFVVATVHVKQLIRALWTVNGASEMEVIIHVHPPHSKNSPDERHLLQPFLKIRSIKRLVVLGVSDQDYVDELTSVVTTTDGMTQTLGQLVAGVRRLKQYIRAERWEHAVEQGENLLVLMADCAVTYGDRYFEAGPVLSQVAMETLISTAMVMAELSILGGDYRSCIHFAKSGLRVSRTFVFQHLIPVHPTVFVHPYHQLPPLTDIMTFRTSRKETWCNMILLHARALMGIKQLPAAFEDLQIAERLMPNNEKVASVFQEWQVMVDALPDS